MVNAFAICAPALLASMDTKTSNDTQARARAWDRYRSYMTRVPPNVGDAGAIFDEGASASLPPYGLEIEFIAGGGQTVPCEYTRESYLAVARHVIAMDGVGLAEGTTVADLKLVNTGYMDPWVKWRDALGRGWEVHADFLIPNSRFKGRDTGGPPGVSTMPGYEVTTPKLTSAAFGLRLMRHLHQLSGLGVIFPCTLRDTAPIHRMCGELMAQPTRQHQDWKRQCHDAGMSRSLNVIAAPYINPTFHVHIDGSGLCSRHGGCRGLVNLVLFHERAEYVMRRMWPVYGHSDCTANFRLAAPDMLRELGALPRAERTMASLRAIFLKHEQQMRLGLCYLLPPNRDRAIHTRTSATKCAETLNEGIAWRWWSIKPVSKRVTPYL